MRVVAGLLSGRRFVAPAGLETRPTTDRVREAIFNALGSLDVVRSALVADLFAGSGGLGIEALSRGAEHVTFVETDRAALTALRQNLRALDLERSATVVAADAVAAANRLDVDVVLADPPYEFDRWDELLSAISAPFVVAEAPHEVDPVPGWQTKRTKRYGRTWVTFLVRVEASAVDRRAGSG